MALAPEDPEEQDGAHEFHFRYNRRLSCFSNPVAALTFSPDGQFLVSGTSAGDAKVWDTGNWAERSRLKGCKKEELLALEISPSQRWLVAAYASVLHIYQSHSPWRMEQAFPALLENAAKDDTRWSCVAFAPMVEVDETGGHTGSDNHMAGFSTTQLVVFDYSGGWGSETPRRTRSIMQSSRAVSLAYTADGQWLMCACESGQFQVWNAFSITLEKTISAHSECINCLKTSPKGANYDTRVVTCGVDQALRVWHSNGWILEQHLYDTRCDRSGIMHCTFSSSGEWLISIASELSVWRVCITRRARMVLQLHQRLAATCGAEGLRTAAFCSTADALAVGSRDGILGLWTKTPGRPPDPGEAPSAGGADKNASRSEPFCANATLPKPMQRITPNGVKPLPSRGEWFQKAHLRTLSMTSLASRGGRLAGGTTFMDTATETLGADRRMMLRNGSLPNVGGWKASAFGLDQVLSHVIRDNVDKSSLRQSTELPPDVSPVRKSMNHACRGLVQRISLDPKIITEHI